MRRIFGYVLFLFGLFVMALSVMAIFFRQPAVDPLLAAGMLAFGLILCVVSIVVATTSTGGTEDAP